MNRSRAIAAGLVFTGFAPFSFALRGDVTASIDEAWARAKAALEKQELPLVDDFKDLGVLRAKRSSSSTNGLDCTRGRGTFVKAELTATITFGKRANGALVADVEVKGFATWYEERRVQGMGTPQTGYDILPCTSTGELEKQLLADIVDPVSPLSPP